MEEDIAALIRGFANAGMGLRMKNVGDVIQDFCEAHELGVWTEAPPSKPFILQFCQRHKLTMRKEVLLSISREEATKNPFVIMSWISTIS